MSTPQIPVRYIGSRPHWEGLLYDVRLRFDQGQTRFLPEPLALKFLKHHDTFVRGEGEPEVKSTEQETTEALAEAQERIEATERADLEVQEVLERIDTMEGPQLAEVASRYGMKLDGRRSLEARRLEVKQLINLHGLT